MTQKTSTDGDDDDDDDEAEGLIIVFRLLLVDEMFLLSNDIVNVVITVIEMSISGRT